MQRKQLLFVVTYTEQIGKVSHLKDRPERGMCEDRRKEGVAFERHEKGKEEERKGKWEKVSREGGGPERASLGPSRPRLRRFGPGAGRAAAPSRRRCPCAGMCPAPSGEGTVASPSPPNLPTGGSRTEKRGTLLEDGGAAAQRRTYKLLAFPLSLRTWFVCFRVYVREQTRSTTSS